MVIIVTWKIKITIKNIQILKNIFAFSSTAISVIVSEAENKNTKENIPIKLS